MDGSPPAPTVAPHADALLPDAHADPADGPLLDAIFDTPDCAGPTAVGEAAMANRPARALCEFDAA